MKIRYIGQDARTVQIFRDHGWVVDGSVWDGWFFDGADVVVLDLRAHPNPRELAPHIATKPILILVDDGCAETAMFFSQFGVVAANSWVDSEKNLIGFVERVFDNGTQVEDGVRLSELLGLNALAHAVTTSLDATMVARRAIEVIAGLADGATIAIYTADPRPTLSGDLAPLVAGTKQWILRAEHAGETPVEVPATLAANRVVEWLPNVTPLDATDSGLWPSDAPTTVTVLPVWATTVVALLVLIESPTIRPIRRDVLVGIGAQLGTALENAWLFEEIGEAYRSLQRAQDQLVYAEKFAAVGLLAAEIAHEINNPAAFVITNLSVMEDYVRTVNTFHLRLQDQADDGPIDGVILHALLQEHEIEFLDEDLATLVRRSLSGLERIHQIVFDLRYFSRKQPTEAGRVDLENLLESTVGLVRHEARYRAEIIFEFDGVPAIVSDANRLSQVFLNLLMNAVQAITMGDAFENRIIISSYLSERGVAIAISDTGPGVAEDLKERIFEPFYTTKEPGSGTGLGLSISRDIVHTLGGTLEVKDTTGGGATFVVDLPVDGWGDT